MSERVSLPARLPGTTVLVAGAGLAGLTAAWQLREWGCEVTVCEARERLGGRVWTVREGFALGQHAEAGADLIDQGQTAILDLVRQLGLEPRRILRDGFRSYRLGDDGVRRVRAGGNGWRELARRLAPEITAYRAAERHWDGPIARALARRSVASWLDQVGAGLALRSFARALRGFFAADPEDLSLLQLVDQLASDDGPGALYRIAGGNDRLATALAAGVTVRLGHVVRAVHSGARRVRVALEDARGRSVEHAADFVVLALPPSTLRDVRVTPALPDPQSEAIRRLRLGAATKGSLQFDRRFWRRNGRPQAFGSDLPHGAVWEANEEQRGRAGILTLLAGGRASAELRACLAREGPGGVCAQLEWLGARNARLLTAHFACWEDERWSRGAYAVFDPSFPPELRAWLARPHGRIVLAGEHTSERWQGYMNGAVESGLRAAYEIAALVEERAGRDGPAFRLRGAFR